MTCSSTSLVQLRSPVLLHLHAPVHGSLTFRQLHLFVEHPDLHPQVIISVQLSGTGARVISLGTSFPSSDLVHPLVSGSGRVGFVLWACLHHFLKVRSSDMPSCCITCWGKCLGGSAPRKQRCTCFITALCISSIVHSRNNYFYGLHSRAIQVSVS